ncbi:MAG: hypothetical protein AAF725_25705, partial [Acidobacteriota bacterium]
MKGGVAQSFLRVEAAGRSWGVHLEQVERVARLEDAQLDFAGDAPTVRPAGEEGSPVDLLTLSGWSLGDASASTPSGFPDSAEAVLEPGRRL